MHRRLVILVLALSLAGLGPVPLSACALSSPHVAECATPASQSHCDHMNMDDGGGTKVTAAQDTSCCSLANAPVSTRGQKAPDRVSLAVSALVVLRASLNLPVLEQHKVVEIEQDISPPPLQPLLCTFLI